MRHTQMVDFRGSVVARVELHMVVPVGCHALTSKIKETREWCAFPRRDDKVTRFGLPQRI